MLKSENHFLEIVSKAFPNTHKHMLVGRGDDCAVLACPAKLCLSSDLFLEDIHFRLKYFSPEDVGYKALAVNLSDLAAHGARPLGFNLNLIWPEYLDSNFCQRMLHGMADLARQFDIGLTGGDLSFGSNLGLAITIWGQSPERILLRGKCRPGDVIFLVGDIGLARCGLMILEHEPELSEKFPLTTSRHLHPLPLVLEGEILAGIESVKGLMDVSDGLVSDLPRFLAQDTGIEIDPDFPVHPEVKEYSQNKNHDPVIFSLTGGEDYALLGGCPPEQWPMIQSRIPSAWKLGTVIPEKGIFLSRKKIQIKGFDHFEKN